MSAFPSIGSPATQASPSLSVDSIRPTGTTLTLPGSMKVATIGEGVGNCRTALAADNCVSLGSFLATGGTISCVSLGSFPVLRLGIIINPHYGLKTGQPFRKQPILYFTIEDILELYRMMLAPGLVKALYDEKVLI
jgi:hypothetical protein